MKKYVLVISIFCVAIFNSSAQEFKKFKVAIGIPFSSYTTDQFSYYAGLDLEPSWRLRDDMTVGFYISYMQSDSETNTDPQRHVMEFGELFTTCLVFDHYFSLNKPNFYYGLMTGVSQHLNQIVERSSVVNGVPTSGEIISNFRNGINISPRVGFNYGHLRAMIMYQIILNEVPDMLTLQVGLEIGGGKMSDN